MTISPLPDGYTTRPPTVEDAPEIAALIAACQVADGDEADMTVEELLSDWRGVNLSEEALAVLAPVGQIVGYADLYSRHFTHVSVYGSVHPDYRGRGIGTYLVRWGEVWTEARMHQAPEHARILVQHYCRTSNEAARRLLEALGYAHVRTHFIMDIALEDEPPAPWWPEGLTVRTFVAGQDEQAVFEAGEEAFGDIWGRAPSTLEAWMLPARAEGFDPTLWFLAEDRSSGQIAGLCLSEVVAGKGHIGQVGVRRQWRRKGLGLALLHHAFGEFYRRGVREVSLSVDAESPTGAPLLYRRAGMRVAKSFARYRKDLRPGEELSAQVARE